MKRLFHLLIVSLSVLALQMPCRGMESAFAPYARFIAQNEAGDWDHMLRQMPAAKQVLLVAFTGGAKAEADADAWCGALMRFRHEEAALNDVEEITAAWLRAAPGSVRAKVHRLSLHAEREDYEEKYTVASELMNSLGLTESEQQWVMMERFDAAIRLPDVQEELFPMLWQTLRHQPAWLVAVLTLACAQIFLVPLLTRYRRRDELSWWHPLLWIGWVVGFALLLLCHLPWAVPAAVLGVLILIFSTTGPRDLGYLRSPRCPSGYGVADWRGVLGWCLLMLIVNLALSAGYFYTYEALAGEPLEQRVAALMETDGLLSMLGTVILAGICVGFSEEILFRGFLQGWLTQKMPVWLASVICALIFGLIHGLQLALPCALMGLILSWLRIRYQSLWPAILVHAANNSLAIIAARLDYE